jgi:membrane associated rhomboid family serine protease
MGIYDRDYYRGQTSGSAWLTGLTPATQWLVITNVIVFVAQLLTHDTVTRALVVTPRSVFEEYQVWRLLTAAFCHGSIWHILWNMLWLWWFGRELEMLYGSREFLIFYLTAAVVASTTWALSNWGGMVPMLGASGAVSAVVVVFTMLYPRRQLLIYGILPVEMRWFVLVWLAYDLFMMVDRGASSSVAFTAHLGGAAYGFLYKLLDLRLGRLVQRPRTRGRGFRVVGSDAATPPPGLGEDLAHRMDEVLAKIAREGPDSLNAGERAILDQASQRLRDRRG